MAQGNLQFRTNKSDDGRNLKLTIFFCGSYRVIFSKWFEPRSISSSYSVIVRVRVVL